MSIRINYNNIKKENIKKILEDTTIVEQQEYISKMVHKKAPNIVRMFKDIGDEILLPYNYAKILNFEHSIERKQGWIKLNKELKFIGEMREYQNEILNEAVQILIKNNGVIIGTPPGSGKTIMASKLWHEIGLLGIVIVNRIKVHEGWINTFKKVCPDCNIWILGQKLEKLPDIIICMDSQVMNIPEEIRMKIGVVIYDEVHLLCTQTRNEIMLSFEPKYVIMESATLEMDNGFHRMATLISGEDGVFRISKTPYNFYRIRTNIFGKQEYGKTGLISASLQKSLAEDPIRQSLILKIIINNLHRKFMIMYRVKSGIEEFAKKCKDVNIEVDTLYGSQKKYKNSKVLIGTVPKMGTGFDEENACEDFYLSPEKSNTIILVNSIKKWQLYEQVRGRVMRSDNPCVIWFVDDNPSCEAHFKSIKPWLIKTNANIIDVKNIDEFRI